MAIDPRIPLMGNAPPQIDVMGTLGRIAQIKRMEAISQQEQQEMALKQQAAQEDAAFKQVMVEAQGDPEKALPRLMQINPARALAFQKLHGDIQKTSAETSAFSRTQKEDEAFKAVLASASDLNAAMPELMKINPKRALEFQKLQREAQGTFQQADVVVDGKTQKATFDPAKGTFQPSGFEAAGSVDDARANEQFAETKRHNQATEAAARATNARLAAGEGGGGAKPGDAQLVKAIIANPGLYAGVTPTTKERLIGPLMEAGFTGFAAGQTGKPPTGAQNRAVNFFNRAKQASDEVEAIEQSLGLVGQAWANNMPNIVQTQEGQAYNAGQRAFTEARLRKDSGAAIPPQEFANDRITYFRQTGDSPETLAQKKRMRAAVLASLAFESGPALHQFYGDEAETILSGYKQAMTRPDGGGNQQQRNVSAPGGGKPRFEIISVK